MAAMVKLQYITMVCQGKHMPCNKLDRCVLTLWNGFCPWRQAMLKTNRRSCMVTQGDSSISLPSAFSFEDFGRSIACAHSSNGVSPSFGWNDGISFRLLLREVFDRLAMMFFNSLLRSSTFQSTSRRWASERLSSHGFKAISAISSSKSGLSSPQLERSDKVLLMDLLSPV